MAAHGSRTPSWPGLSTARDIAAAAGVRSVGTQHVLLAVLRRGDPDVAAVLGAGRVDEISVAAALDGIAGTGCRTESVPTERVSVSPGVLALIRAAGGPGADVVTDLQVLGALLTGDEPSLARAVLDLLGAHRRVLHAYRAVPARVDDGGGHLVGA